MLYIFVDHVGNSSTVPMRRSSAPEGRRTVATGAGRRGRPKPVDPRRAARPAPGGAEEFCRSRASCPLQPARFLCPAGAELRNESVFHGFRSARLRPGCASPVATLRGPAGAEARLAPPTSRIRRGAPDGRAPATRATSRHAGETARGIGSLRVRLHPSKGDSPQRHEDTEKEHIQEILPRPCCRTPPLFAPTGRRAVATGGASAGRSPRELNPWTA